LTSLIEQFLYPKFGPGQLWETVASEIKRLGGEILLNASVEKLSCESKLSIESISIRNLKSGELKIIRGDYFLSSMPIRSLVENLSGCDVPKNVMDVTNGLQYRDFLIVGLLVSNLENENAEKAGIQDNWIYLQDKDIKAGRLQLFHNWSPFMIANQSNRWLGIEYFCNEDDSFWKLSDEKIIEQGIFEMSKIGLIKSSNVIDATLVRVKKAYPSYYGSYSELHIFQHFINKFDNLYLMGRNGLHRYNNTDHSMLTAMAVVDNIRLGKTDKTSVWDINTEMEYHESKV
jgi:protoporphyrinogen oxidase